MGDDMCSCLACVIAMDDVHFIYSYLLQFVRDHGESSEDAVCGASDGDDPLRTGALWDVDPSVALWSQLKVSINWTVKHFGKHVYFLCIRELDEMLNTRFMFVC